jgi:hypothetical protein
MEDGISLIGDLFKIEQCIRIGSPETRKLVLINEEQYKSLSPVQQKRYRRIINGLDLVQYRINWSNMFLKYEPETDNEKLYLSKKPLIFERKKLFFRNTSKFLTVAYDCGDSSKSDHEKYFYALNTVYLIFLKGKYNNDIVDFLSKYALAYLNSPLAEFYYRSMFWGLVVPGGSIKYREILRFLPFKLPETSIEENFIQKIVANVDSIFEAYANDFDIKKYLKRINELLFTLYDFNSLEIKQIKQFLINFCPSYSFDIKTKRS